MKHSFIVVVVLVSTTTGCLWSVPSPTNDDADDVVVVVAMETLLLGFLENTVRRENRDAFAGVLWTPDGTLRPLIFMTMITML